MKSAIVHDFCYGGGPVVGQTIMCPACDSRHEFWTAVPYKNGSQWSFNGDYDKPTFSPSMLIRIGPMPTVPVGRPDAGMIHVCHSFVTDGKIQFLADCTHAMAGQTVDLMPFRTV
jgi:hypothetical protein